MNRKALVLAICTSLVLAGTASAESSSAPAPQTQDQSSSDQQSSSNDAQQQAADESGEVVELEVMTVTGSLLNRPEYQTVVPVQVIPIEVSIATGSFGTAAILQSSAVAAGSTQINNQFSGFIVGGGTGIQTIDLRGLGANRSLVLLDGQRPGPSGVQGQTGSGFDLNVVPSVILGRAEIVKTGASSIYGSDAISGVVNLITRKRLEGTEMTFGVYLPEAGGGEQYTGSIGTGFNFDNGNIVVAAQIQEQSPLALGDRDFFECPDDLVWNADGQRIDREDRSIIGGTPLGGCSAGNLYANTIIDYFNPSTRYVPSPDGSTVGPFPGYRPRDNGRYDDGDSEPAFYEDVLNYPFAGDEWVINKNRNATFYASSFFNFNAVSWTNQLLYNHRETNTQGFRQFFPIVYNADDGGYYQPIMPFTSNNDVKIDYYYLRTNLAGGFGNSTWYWEANATYSHSDGEYSHVGIDARKSGALGYAVNEVPPGETQEYFTPGYLSGENMQQLIDQVGYVFTGNTLYTQSTVNAVFTGDLFSLPAGEVSAAVGAEYRRYEIDDQPDPANSAGFEWGYSSAQETVGEDDVTEVFTEIGIPILEGMPGVESLTGNISARAFKYASVGDSDYVWKGGLNWQVTPTFRVRGSVGTSYRAPALYELYLGNQSGFLSQISVDPCILWQDSTNVNIRENCAAAGIPGDYAGGGASAEVFKGGGAGFLEPETSKAKSLGVVWTPTGGNFNVALDYFDYHIEGEIGTLDASDILFGCYGREVYPNDFCGLFNRNSPDAAADANKITEVYATFININSERSRGYDFQLNYSNDFSFGKLSADAQITYTIEDSVQLFDSAAASGTTTTNFVGFIGRPKTVGLTHVSLNRGDWTYSWQGFYTSSTSNKNLDGIFSYFGYENAVRDVRADWQFRHNVSVAYNTGKWGALFGIRNLLDQEPDLISGGVDTRRGNVPIGASQYDWFGRTYFARVNYSF